MAMIVDVSKTGLVLVVYYYLLMEQKVVSKEERPHIPFAKHDMEDLYLRRDVPGSLNKDLWKWSQGFDFSSQLRHQLYDWIFSQENKQKGLLVQTTKMAVQVIDYLLLQDLPLTVVDVYLSLLSRNKKEIQQYLTHQAADKLYKFIPSPLIVNYLSVFDIKLTDKEKDSLLRELIQDRKTCNLELARLPEIFKDKALYGKILIDSLVEQKKNDLAINVMKKLKMGKEEHPEVQMHLIEVAAISMPRWEKRFCWQMLEEVFEYYPTAIAACIRSTMNRRHQSQQTIQGFASICKRNPVVLKNIYGKTRDSLKDIKEALPNKYRTNTFEPSNPAKCLSLIECGYSEKSVVMVNEDNIRQCLESMCAEKVIGIDTESRVARTSLDKSYDVLATIQIATSQNVFIFDAFALKRNPLNFSPIKQFFRNKEVTIIGHTLDGDLNHDVTSLFGYVGHVECQRVDICPLFSGLYPEQGKGLANICKVILGKELCKEYTMTNWERRPLYRNQIHYAALDAVSVVMVWQKLKQNKGFEGAVKEIKKSKERRDQERRLKEEKKGEKRGDRLKEKEKCKEDRKREDKPKFKPKQQEKLN